MRRLVAIVLCLAIAGPPLASTGCTQAQAANVISTIEQYLQYVSTFVQGAQVVWPIISALLGQGVSPKANQDFTIALQGVTDAQVAMEDALAAAKAANDPNPDLSAVIAQCQAAVAQVISIVNLYRAQTAGTLLGSSLTTLQHQAQVIASWR